VAGDTFGSCCHQVLSSRADVPYSSRTDISRPTGDCSRIAQPAPEAQLHLHFYPSPCTNTGQIHYQPASGSSAAPSQKTELSQPGQTLRGAEWALAHGSKQHTGRASCCPGLTILHNPACKRLKERGEGRAMLPAAHPLGSLGVRDLLQQVLHPTSVFNSS